MSFIEGDWRAAQAKLYADSERALAALAAQITGSISAGCGGDCGCEDCGSTPNATSSVRQLRRPGSAHSSAAGTRSGFPRGPGDPPPPAGTGLSFPPSPPPPPTVPRNLYGFPKPPPGPGSDDYHWPWPDPGPEPPGPYNEPPSGLMGQCKIETPRPGPVTRSPIPGIGGGLVIGDTGQYEYQGVGGYAGLAGQAQTATSPMGGAPGGFVGPPAPLCPPNYYFDYDWQSCWHVDNPAPPAPPHWPHACKCEDGYSWLAEPPDGDPRCWERGELGAHVYAGSVGNLGAGLVCAFGEQFDASQGCIPNNCGYWTTWSHSAQGCVLNECSATFVAPMWQHLPGDCTGGVDDAFEDAVNDAIHWIGRLVMPALRMIRFMRGNEHISVFADGEQISYAEYLWNFGYSPGLGGPGLWHSDDPSMLAWLGPYTPFRLELADEILTRALCRCSWTDRRSLETYSGFLDASASDAALEHPVTIRCWNWDACGVGYYGYTLANTVNLCPTWIERDYNGRGRALLHELLHYALSGWVVNFPKDIIDTGCGGKCYGEDRATFLAQNPEIMDSALNVDNWSWFDTPAAFRNTDNWVTWVVKRFMSFEHCMVPEGASIP